MKRAQRLAQAATLSLALVLSPATLLLSSSAMAQTGNVVELEELMPKIYLAYGGREALSALDKNYVLLGDRTSTEGDTTTTVHYRQARKSNNLRIDVEPGGEAAPISTVFDGMSAWKAIGKVVEDLGGEQEKALRAERYHEPSVLVHFQDPGYTFKFQGRTTYHATPVYAIDVQHENDEPATFYIDEKNFQVLAVQFKAVDPETKKPVTIAIDYSEYRPAAGTMVPFKQVQSANEKEISQLAISSIDAQTPVDDVQFRRPDKPGEVRLSKSQTLPFEYSHKEIVVKARINDNAEPMDFLLDTAASQTVIDRRTAAENFLDKGPNFTVTAVGGNVPTQMTSIDRLYLGDVEVGDVQALMLDLSPQARQMGKRISGIIGANVLNRFAVTIDYAHSQIVLNDLQTYKPPANAVVVPMTQHKGTPQVRAMVNGSEVPFLVDTGAAFNNLPTKIAKNFVSGQTPHMTEGTGLDGRPVRLATMAANTVKIGQQLVRNVNFTYSVDQDAQVQAKGGIQGGNLGVLGNPFWQAFAMTLDYKFQRIVLQPNTSATARQEIDAVISQGDKKLAIYRDLRGAEAAYQKALMMVQNIGDPRYQAKVWGRIGNLRRVMAKDLNRPEQARIAYEYFSKAQEQAHRLQDRDTEGRILGDWSLLYLDNGQIPAAQQALQGATLFAPQDPQVNVDFAVYLYKMQMYPDMHKYLEKALFLDPSDWQALWYKVKLAEMFGDTAQMAQTLKDILKYYPWSKLARDKLAALSNPQTVPPGMQVPGAPGTPTAVTPPGAVAPQTVPTVPAMPGMMPPPQQQPPSITPTPFRR